MRVFVPLMTLILFSAYTGYVMILADQSLIAFGQQLMSRLDTAQVVIDLYIMAGLAGVWMYQDNKRRGGSLASVLPYFVVTAVFVAIGPLLYLVVRGLSKPTPEGRSQVRT